MAKEEATVEELVSMIERGELRLPEMQRQYVWQAPRVRDLLDSLYRGYPSGAILIWETDEEVAQRDMAVAQNKNPYQATRLLLDGQQRLTTLLDFHNDSFSDHHGNYYSGLSDLAQRSFDGCRTTSLVLPPSASAADIISAFLSINDRGTKVPKSHIEKVRSIPV